MQTMPTKTRTAVTVGAVLLVMLVGGVFMLSRRAKDTTPMHAKDPYLTGDMNGATHIASDTDSTLSTSADAAANSNGTAAGSSQSSLDLVPATHKVAAGETLYAISTHYYGSHVYAGDIEHVNHLTNPNKLYSGQELQLPKLADLKH